MATNKHMSRINIIFLTRESHPTFRPDVTTLFGKYLPRHGIFSTLVTKCTETNQTWLGGSVKCINTFSLVKVIRTIKACENNSLVQVRDMPLLALPICIWAKLTGRKFFYWQSYPFAEDDIRKYNYLGPCTPLPKRIYFFLRGHIQLMVLYRIIAPLCNHFFVQSEEMKCILNKNNKIPLGLMTSVPMGIDLDEVGHNDLLCTSNPVAYQENQIAYLGVINRLRMDSVFFDVIYELLNMFKDVNIIFIGGGQNPEDEVWLRERLDGMGFSKRYDITGWLSREEGLRKVSGTYMAVSILPRDKILDMSSPTKAVEYAAFGIPCVGTDIPDQKYVIETLQSGIAVPHSKDEILNAISTLLNDRTLRDKQSKNGRARVGKLRSYEIIANNLANVYKNLANTP